MVPRPASPGPAAPLLPQFYAGRSLFITGATGFLGKVLVERLLTTCPDISRLFLLMRDKKGHAPQKRLHLLKQSQVFENVQARDPAQLDKLVAIAGDVTKPQLGLDDDAIAMLREVSIVFHSAATLRFEEPLSVAVEQNVRSVERLLDICDQLPNMEAFVHVSTAYSNAELSRVEERVYRPPRPLEHVYAVTAALPDHLLADITSKYISPKPNTYTFTKSLAESAVEQHGNKGYPVAIFRPTIVISSLRHPFPGWIENLNGPSGVVVAGGKGLLHVITCKDSAVADMLPVDVAIDTLLAVAWETAVDRPPQVKVYNCSTCENPTTWLQFRDSIRDSLRAHPLDHALWYPWGFCAQSLIATTVLGTLLHTIPLYVAQCIVKVFGIKTRLSFITLNQRLKAMNSVLRFFATREWRFSTDNVKRLHARLSAADREIYNLDPHTIDWKEHFTNFVKGTRKYLLQEKEQDLVEAKKHIKKMYFVHQGAILFVFVLVCRLALSNEHLRAFIYRSVRFIFIVFNLVYERIVQKN